MMISKKLQYFYLSYFGLNSIISIIAPILCFSNSLYYIFLLILTLSLIGLYFYVYFRKNEYLAPLTQFFIFYGFINILLIMDFGWPSWLIGAIAMIDFIGIFIYYYINSRRMKKTKFR